MFIFCFNGAIIILSTGSRYIKAVCLNSTQIQLIILQDVYNRASAASLILDQRQPTITDCLQSISMHVTFTEQCLCSLLPFQLFDALQKKASHF